MAKKGWVDFKKVKEALSIERVLGHYNLSLKPAGEGELRGRCPFHEDTKPSFSVNKVKNVFHCFGCSAKGNVLDLIRLKEGVDVRRAALLAVEWFDIGGAVKEPPKSKKTPQNQKAKEKAKEPETKPPRQPEAPKPAQKVNKPLTFQLKLDQDNEYLKSRGVDPELAQFFGVGYCSRGMMKGRIAIPIHNERGEPVAYLGRWPGEDLPEGESKYLLPPGFHKNLVLYNLHRVDGAEHLVIVEDCWSVFRLHKLGVPAVALLGRSLSPEQEELLSGAGPQRVSLLLDGDAAGQEAQGELLPQLARRFFVRSVRLPDGEEPDTLDEGVLLELLKF